MSNTATVQGTIVKVGEVQSIGENNFKKREVVVNTGGQYPQEIKVELVKDKAENFDLGVGASTTFDCNLRGRRFKGNDGTDKFFVSIEAWRWTSAAVNTPVSSSEPVSATPQGDDSQDLPF